jgi:hypothetical protein
MFFPSICRLFIGLCCAGVGGRAAAFSGFDVGADARDALAIISSEPALASQQGTWLRIRGITAMTDNADLSREQEALRELHRRGFLNCALIEWDGRSWAGGVRKGGGRRGPVDLREVWARARTLGRLYSELVDMWEIGNEPDISFLEDNPENYAAYLKACRAGLLAGAVEAGGAKPRVLMAPLALPPGPYLARLWENGAGSATDGFNFHFYGYAEDFTGVYEQFRDAIEKAPTSADSGGPARKKSFPVFLTEYGYGLMDAAGGASAEGRLRQWRWFHAVGAQLKGLRPAGAMAFVLTPYLEQGQSEFGLLMAAHDGPPQERFAPADFGATAEEPWMRLVGRPIGAAEISPALAWLLREEKTERALSARDWRGAGDVSAGPVVLDFVPREGLAPRKSFLGYFAQRPAGVAGEGGGQGELVAYNFSTGKITGEIHLGAGLVLDDAGAGDGLALSLAPGERRVIAVRTVLNATVLEGLRSETTFTSSEGARTQFVTTLWPDPSTMTREVVRDFAFDASTADGSRKTLLTRTRAQEEPALSCEGRWLVSRGVTVAEADGAWTFMVSAFPGEPLRPAMAELPLPAGFRFSPGTLLEFSYRLAEGSADKESWFDVYFRTENGNLYQVWPRMLADREWHGYAEAAENFTMGFYGRAQLPWRFSENKPVALVFFFRPEKLPAMFSIEDAAITRRVDAK